MRPSDRRLPFDRLAQRAWWQRGVVYQVYPRSFMDANGDGVGDLAGISARLDYLAWLGVDAVWLSPFYPSPMADFGYDVTDHTGVDALFGVMADFDALVDRAHRLGLRVILDYIPNHTSSEHPWFAAARSARDNPYHDWYIWRDAGPGGGLPNNWLSVFGGPAWTYEPGLGQYYYHAYLVQQPDLNWRNPAVQAAMLDVLRFWLERGVDGFRIDALRQLIKDDRWRDNPPNPDYRPGHNPYEQLLPVYTTDRPEIHAMIARMRAVADSYGPGRVLIGELYLPIARLVTYYGENGAGLQLPFNFHLIQTPWAARAIEDVIRRYEAALPAYGWPNWVLGNHDRHRIASRVGPEQARVAAMLLLTLRGTPTLYYGDEIGMADVDIPPAAVQDPWEKNVPGLGLGRDPERTPMQWASGPNAGFTTGGPWLPLAGDYRQVNVATERADPGSTLCLYRGLLALRRRSPALAGGSYRPVRAEGNVLAYERAAGGERYLVALNLGASPQTLPLAADASRAHVVIGTQPGRDGAPAGPVLGLGPNEGLLLRVE